MRLKFLLPLLLSPLLVGCQGGPPAQDRLMAWIYIEKNPALDVYSYDEPHTSMTFVTEPVAPAIRPQVKEVRIIIASRTFLARPGDDVVKPDVYVWDTERPCQDLPQGDRLPVRYEMRDANQQVLQEATITVNLHTCG